MPFEVTKIHLIITLGLVKFKLVYVKFKLVYVEDPVSKKYNNSRFFEVKADRRSGLKSNPTQFFRMGTLGLVFSGRKMFTTIFNEHT